MNSRRLMQAVIGSPSGRKGWCGLNDTTRGVPRGGVPRGLSVFACLIYLDPTMLSPPRVLPAGLLRWRPRKTGADDEQH
jgi:hypothetical protein